MEAAPPSEVVTINVGGQIFQTTRQTLTQSGSKALISLTQNRDSQFIDRDPETFAILLSLLRTGTLSSQAKSLHLDDLILESQFYGIEHLLISALSSPDLLEPFTLEKSLILPLSGRDYPSAMSTTTLGTLHVSHGSKITSYDWSLRRKSTTLTEFSAIDSLAALTSNLLVAGATDFYGMQVIDLNNGRVRKKLDWENVTMSGSTVQAIGTSSKLVFTSFESARRNSSCIIAYDSSNFEPVAEIGHVETYGADFAGAIPATKLEWVSSHNLLLAAGSHGGPSGFTGNVRLWDIRSNKAIWELKEDSDCFSDITFSERFSSVFKVGVNSGDLGFLDLRRVEAGGDVAPWVCVSRSDNRGLGSVRKVGLGCKIVAEGDHLFVSRGGDIELWSEVVMESSSKQEDALPERVFRKNVLGRMKDMGGKRVTNLKFGGNKMMVTRSDVNSIEVWESSGKFSSGLMT